MDKVIMRTSKIIMKGKTNNGDISKSYFQFLDYKDNNDPVLYIRTLVLAPIDNIYNDFNIVFKRYGICLMERRFSIKHKTLFGGIKKLSDKLNTENIRNND